MTKLPRASRGSPSDESPDLVRAAGGVVWRRGSDAVEVLVVHRPKYDDWSLPKGKRDPGESDEDCARREVMEETGLECALGDELPCVRYVDRKGRPKLVRYWAMKGPATGGSCGSSYEFVPNDEVDGIRWLSVPDAQRLLSYDHDAEVVAELDPSG